MRAKRALDPELYPAYQRSYRRARLRRVKSTVLEFLQHGTFFAACGDMWKI
jgi:hypothetical protein